MHYSVLLTETVEWMNIQPSGIYADLTCGRGGHTRAIAERAPQGKVFACDRDAESLAIARENLAGLNNIEFLHTTFSNAPQALQERGIKRLDGLTADLGVSRPQLTTPERGFSFMEDGPLDMRMDRTQEITAADLVNQLPERELANLFYQLAEERRSYAIAKALVRARPVKTSLQAAEIIARAVPRTSHKLHPATLTFMALRMAVNNELEEVTSLMEALPKLIHPGGRAVIISFHSGEDRIVKQAFQRIRKEGRARILTKHVVKPTDREVYENAASRSAKLRALELI